MHALDIWHDADAPNPREERDTFTRMLCVRHPRYALGDEQYSDPLGIDAEVVRVSRDHATFSMPLYLLDHSGLALSTEPFPCRWDSGRIGTVLVTRDALENAGLEPTAENAHMLIHDEIEEYQQWLNGDVWGFSISDPDDPHGMLTGCGGIYGREEAERLGVAELKTLIGG